jgi:hypothetical protein
MTINIELLEQPKRGFLAECIVSDVEVLGMNQVNHLINNWVERRPMPLPEKPRFGSWAGLCVLCASARECSVLA